MPSWSRSQQLTFAAQGARHRHDTDASPATSDGKSLCVYHSAVRSHRDIEGGGFDLIPDFIGRVNMDLYPWFTPAKGALLVIDGAPYMITVVAKITRGREWFFGLGPA